MQDSSGDFLALWYINSRVPTYKKKKNTNLVVSRLAHNDAQNTQVRGLVNDTDVWFFITILL